MRYQNWMLQKWPNAAQKKIISGAARLVKRVDWSNTRYINTCTWYIKTSQNCIFLSVLARWFRYVIGRIILKAKRSYIGSRKTQACVCEIFVWFRITARWSIGPTIQYQLNNIIQLCTTVPSKCWPLICWKPNIIIARFVWTSIVAADHVPNHHLFSHSQKPSLRSSQQFYYRKFTKS